MWFRAMNSSANIYWKKYRPTKSLLNLTEMSRLQFDICAASMFRFRDWKMHKQKFKCPHSLISIFLPAVGKYVQVRHTMQCQRGFKGLLSLPWNVRFLTRRSQPNTKAKGEKAEPERIEQRTEREENGNQNDRYAISTGGPRWLFQRMSAFLHLWHGFGLCWMPWRNETQISESVLSCWSEAGSYLGIHCNAGEHQMPQHFPYIVQCNLFMMLWD